MTLASGVRLGPYEILALLGAGGMGEVYRARDTKLNRDVALKILPDLFVADPERLARFQREAQVLASLNHPHIAAIYGFEESGHTHALVLELVEGPTLADRIAQGAIPLGDALPIARQIAEALEAAHERGIIHRDLKPANIKLRPDGTVKVLDFGLAKLSDAGSGLGRHDLSLSPTITSPAKMTGVGVLLGTAAYMAPEQARGIEVDRRADVWAFGCVVFEMLTGARPFDGDNVTDVLARVIERTPDLGRLPPATPRAVRTMLRRCLEKDRRRRLPDMAGARLDLDDAIAEPAETVETSRHGRGQPFVWAVTTALLVLGAATGTWLYRTGASPEPMWLSILPPAGSFGASPAPAISADGRRVAFTALDSAGSPVLWVRDLDSPAARELPGTQGADLPFWSPDQRSLGFFADGKLKTIELSGGSPQSLATAPNQRGGTWGADNLIVFGPVGGSTLYRVSASGGSISPVTTLNAAHGELSHTFPHFLPDGRHFLYHVNSTEQRVSGLYVGSIDSPEVKQIAATRSRAEYSQGFLIFGRDGNLLAQPFDQERLELSGEPIRIAENLGVSYGDLENYAFSVSTTGTMTYWGGSFIHRTRITMLDGEGRIVARPGDTGEYYEVVVSPDQTRVALEQRDPKANVVDVWLMELATGIRSRFTSSGSVGWVGAPLWSPDGTRILFTEFTNEFHVKSVRGDEVDSIALPPGFPQGGWPLSWSSDGRYVVVAQNDPETGWDLWMLPMTGDHKLTPYLRTPFQERQPDTSPDSLWMAYTSDESGRREVYIDSFPRPGNRIQVSTNGGLRPRWARGGRELFYLTPAGMLTAARISSSQDGIRITSTRTLFEIPPIDPLTTRPQFAVLGDGDRFLFNAFVDDPNSQGVTVITDWLALTRKQ